MQRAIGIVVAGGCGAEGEFELSHVLRQFADACADGVPVSNEQAIRCGVFEQLHRRFERFEEAATALLFLGGRVHSVQLFQVRTEAIE